MLKIEFVLAVAAAFLILFRWGFRNLPAERWQFLAAAPIRRNDDGRWSGVNFTFYGFFSALGVVSAVALAIVLLGAIGMAPASMFFLVAIICAICIPAASLVARVVEGKRNAFTVGGAAFIGTLLIPWASFLAKRIFPSAAPVAVVDTFAALAVAYALGESIGRLGCISFGCCYGKLVSDCPSWLRRALATHAAVFHGKTKKIAYAARLDGKPVVPIQAMTSLVFLVAGISGLALFLAGRSVPALVTVGLITMLWRAASEALRADWRGGGRFTAYQWMSLIALGYVIAAAIMLPPSGLAPDLSAGLALVWRPEAILGLQGLALIQFLNAGRSVVTVATISFHVRRELS